MDGGTVRPNAFRVAQDTAPLWPAERLLIWSFRRWAVGFRENCVHQWALVWREFRQAFGGDEAWPALAAFAALFKELMIHGRRTVHAHQPCCPCLGGDEAWLLSFVGACQNGDWLGARALAEAMVEVDGVGDLLHAGSSLAARLRGRSLTVRGDAFEGHDWAAEIVGTIH